MSSYLFLASLSLIIAHFIYIWKFPFNSTKDFIFVCFVTLLGVILEIIFIKTGIIIYDIDGIFPPFFVMSLYALLALIINQIPTKTTQNKIYMFLFGDLIMPFVYFIGYFLDGLNFTYPMFITWFLLNFLWGPYMLLISCIKNAIDDAAIKTWQEKDNQNELKLFFDGDCPICSREMNHLKAKTQNDSMKFIDITEKDDFEKERGNLDYETAMRAMHATDEKGNKLVALDAFAVVYARSHYYILATLLNIPFLRPILDPMYRLFAKHRLLITGRTKKEEKK